MILVNGRDHLKIRVKIVENKVKEAYAKLCELHNLIGAKVKYAADIKAGFLVTDLEGVGSGGLKMEVMIKGTVQVPAREKVKPSPFVTIIKEKDVIRIRGKAKFGAGPAEMIQAVYQVISDNKKITA